MWASTPTRFAQLIKYHIYLAENFSIIFSKVNYLYRDYWANEEERKEILEKEKYDLNILEKEKTFFLEFSFFFSNY